MAIKPPSRESMFHENFDETYKASPNFQDKNHIRRCIAEGKSPEECAMELKIRVASIKRYYPQDEEVAELEAAAEKEQAEADAAAEVAEKEQAEADEAKAKAAAAKKGK